MTDEHNVYRNLRKHLDKMPVGYPATKSGVELAILSLLSTVDEIQSM
jgi:hypothetical protein